MAFVGGMCTRKRAASSVRSTLVGRRESMIELLLLRRRDINLRMRQFWVPASLFASALLEGVKAGVKAWESRASGAGLEFDW